MTFILGDPRTTTNHPPVAQVASDSILLTKDLYSSKWIRTLSDKKCPKTLLITVISAPNHVAEREAIRLGEVYLVEELLNEIYFWLI